MLYWLMHAAQWLARTIPRRARWWLGGTATEAVYWLWPAKRLATQKNMSVVLDLPLTHKLVRYAARRSWYNYGRFVADTFDFGNHTTEGHLAEFNDSENSLSTAFSQIEQSRTSGHSVIVVSAHFGNWEKAGLLVASRYPFYALAERLGDERLNHEFQEQRRRFGMTVIMVEDSVRTLMRLLKSGEMVATPIDSPLPAGEGVPVQFFGRTAYVPRGIGALAVKYQSELMAGFSWFNDRDGYSAKIFPSKIFEAGDNAEAATIAATQFMFDGLEVMIRQDPTQWYMFRQFWPDESLAAPRQS